MIPELGQVFLILALFAAVYQGIFPMIGTARGDRALMAGARSAAYVQLLFVVAAFAVLTYVHATSDFSVLNVVQNSHSAKPFVYKVSGVWGSHEGSMLLWVLILAGFGGVLAINATIMTPLKARTLAVQGLLAAAFLMFLIFTSNPFERLFPAAPDGQDLNPLLQDPGLAIHPPFLYLGYVGFSIVFAFAAAGLIGGRIDETWARTVRPYALAAWIFLTIGIGLGSWWAYYELGWGGFWAWDPVENASFMPWLAGVALIHSIRVLEVRGAFKAWTALLAILAFSLSLIGTFLVRSGIITSVHAFAVDPERGVFILLILALSIGGALALFAIRGPALVSTAKFDGVSREGGLLANNIVLVAACATVFIGTFYPLFAEVVTGEKLSVGAPYFNLVFVPFAGLTLALVAPAATLAWKRADWRTALIRLWPALGAAAVGLVIAAFVATPRTVASIAAVGLAVWAGAGVLLDLGRRARVGQPGWPARLAGLPANAFAMTIGHLGLAIVTIGVVGVGAWKTETILYANPGDRFAVGGYEARLEAVENVQGPNYSAQRARFVVLDGDRPIKAMSAEKRFYPVRGMQTTEAGIWTTLGGDLYLTIGDNNPDKGWVVRAWSHPLTIWMWIGAGLIALGGIIGLAGSSARKPKAVTQNIGKVGQTGLST